jgi:hypothetical protein
MRRGQAESKRLNVAPAMRLLLVALAGVPLPSAAQASDGDAAASCGADFATSLKSARAALDAATTADIRQALACVIHALELQQSELQAIRDGGKTRVLVVPQSETGPGR